MALADDVFTDIRTPSDLDDRSRCLDPRAGSYEFRIKPEKADIPVLRQISREKMVHPTKIITGSSLNHHLRDLGYRCGYKENITSYAFRRGFANGMEGRASAPVMRQLMGHSNDGILQSYLSADVGIHTQNVVRGLAPDRTKIDFARSIGFSLHPHAPLPSSALPGVHPFSKAETSLTGKKRKAHLNHARKQELIDAREKFFQGSTSDYASPTLELRTIIHKTILDFNTYQRQAVDILWGQKESSNSLLLDGLLSLADPKVFAPFYSNVDCSVTESKEHTQCFQRLDSRPGSRNVHFLKCHAMKIQDAGARYCLDCRVCIDDQDKHDKMVHLPHDALYGVVVWRQLILRTGRCPFCVNVARRQGQRDGLQRYLDSRLLAGHIEYYHLSPTVSKCPHPSCQDITMSKAELRQHLWTSHMIALKKTSVEEPARNTGAPIGCE